MYAAAGDVSSTNPWDGLLAWATVALAVATVGLVVVGAVAAIVGIRQLRAARQDFAASRAEATTMALGAAEAAARASEAVMADHLRRRGEATMAAVQRFIDKYTAQHELLLGLARQEQGRTVKQVLMSGDKAALETMQEQLDALEVLSTGARMQIYDINVIYQTARSVILQLWDRSTSYRNDLRDGKFDTRPAQASAYEHSKWLRDQIDDKNEGGPVHLDGTLPPIAVSQTT